MTNTRPPVRGSQPPPLRESRPSQPYGSNLPYGFAGERRPSAPAPKGSSWASAVLLYGGVALLALGVGAATFFAMSPPTDLIQREIIARVKAETGRELHIAGPTAFTIFPSLGLQFGDISLSAPPSMGGEPLVKASRLKVGVQLMPLLRRQIVIDRVQLDDPVFSLRVDSDGRRSWDLAGATLPFRFAGASGSRLGDLIVSPAAAAPHERSPLSLDDLTITNGAVRYNNERNGAWGRFDGIDARFSLAALDEPLFGSGSFLADGETFQFKSTLTTPADLAARRPARLALDVSGPPLAFTYDGTVGEESATGTFNAHAPSLSALAHWWGTDVSPEAGAGEVAFVAALDTNGKAVRLSNIDLKAGRAAATGTIGFEPRDGARPHVTADLRISGIDLAALPLGADLRANAGRGKAVPAPTPLSLPGTGEPSPSEPQSIDDLLDRPGPRVKGYTQRADWSTEPIDIKALGLVDADARLALTDVSYGRTRIEAAQVALAIEDQVARLTLADIRLYNGIGHGVVTLDATGSDTAVTSDISLTGIAAGPLLRDSAQLAWLDGNADVAWKVSGRGTTQAGIVASLNGTSRVAIDNGAVIGFDLGGALNELSQGGIPRFAYDASKKTSFRALTGTFTIANGIAANNDLRLDSPHLHAMGAGTIDLPQRSLDYTVRPKLVANLAGDGGEQNAVGIEIPVHITGPWQQPEFTPDVAGALNSQGTVDAVKQIGKQFKGKKVGEIVQDLLGDGANGEPSKAQKLLDNLFRKK